MFVYLFHYVFFLIDEWIVLVQSQVACRTGDSLMRIYDVVCTPSGCFVIVSAIKT